MAGVGSEAVIQVDDELLITTYALAYGGEGIAKHKGVVVFVPDALPGDEVKVKITQVKKRFARGEIIALKNSSDKRVTPFCNSAKVCGGCGWQQLDYQAQLKAKQAFVENAIQYIGKLKAIHILPPIKAIPDIGYRHKIQIPFQSDKQGVKSGFYAKHTHDVVSVDECPVQPLLGNKIYKTVKNLIEAYGYSCYNEQINKGQIRHLVIRIGAHTKEAMVILVSREARLPKLQEFVNELHKLLPEVVGVVLNINDAKSNVILGTVFKCIFGRAYIYEEIRKIRYRISAESFFQVNPFQMENLAETVMNYAGLSGKEKVVDVYCGVGFFALEAAKRARMVVGIEVVKSAIEDAQANKHLNQMTNVEFICGDAKKGVDQLIAKGFVPDVLFVDPPRKGCDEQLLKKMISWKTKKIVYVSCNPITLARDLAILNCGGYRVQQIQPIDLFPHTYHIESVASLVRKHH